MKKGIISVFVVLISVFSSLADADKAPDNKITNQIYKVAATNDEWTETTIKVVPGDFLVTVEPGSKIVVGAFIGSVDANGEADGVGALFLKIGVGAGIKIGRRSFIAVTEPGVVKLRVYDTKYSDNSGSYQVEILRIPASMIPPAQVVDAMQ